MLILLNVFETVRLLFNFFLEQLDASCCFLGIHKCTGNILAQVGIHAVDSIEPEVLESIGVLSEGVGLLYVVRLWSLEADVLGHLLWRGVEPLAVTHWLLRLLFG